MNVIHEAKELVREIHVVLKIRQGILTKIKIVVSEGLREAITYSQGFIFCYMTKRLFLSIITSIFQQGSYL